MKAQSWKVIGLTNWLLIGLTALAIYGCSSVNHLKAVGVPTILDLHGVEPADGSDRYDVTSISDINRDVRIAADEPLLPTALAQGDTGEWSWTLYGTKKSRARILSFDAPRTATVDTDGVAHTVTIPSWVMAMSRLRDIITAVIGEDAPALQLQLAFYDENTPVRLTKTMGSNSAIPLYFAFSVPDDVIQGGPDAYRWLVDTLELVGHEYWHVYDMRHEPAHYVNEMTEEITAYTLQNCTKLALLDGQGGLELHDLGGPLVDVGRLEEQRRKQLATGGPAELSNKARLVAIYNIAHLINGNIVKQGDIATAQKIYGLCYAMVHHPVDLTNEFYPTDAVKPLNFR